MQRKAPTKTNRGSARPMASPSSRRGARATPLAAAASAGVSALAPAASLESLLRSVLPHWPGIFFRQRPDLTFEIVGGDLFELTGVPVARWERAPDVFWGLVHELDEEEVRRQLSEAAERTEPASPRKRKKARFRKTDRGRFATNA